MTEHKKTHYTVPDGYFDHLTDHVMDKIRTEKQRPKLTVLLKPYVWLAALFIMAVLFRFAMPYFVSSENTANPTVNISVNSTEPTSEEIIEYILDEEENYDALYAELY